MTVFVDGAVHPFGRMLMCHMTAHTLDELYDMVDRINVPRKWIQIPPKVHFVHFDISKGKRAFALQLGAKQCDSRRLVRISAQLTLDSYPQFANDFVRMTAAGPE